MIMKFFVDDINEVDTDVAALIHHEKERLQSSVELIASENIVSKAVLQAQGSILTNKYAEGYPHKRYYGGCEYVDGVEDLAISRLKQLFSAEYVNVQPHSGSQANQAVYLSLLKPGDKIVSLSLDSGGHLSHGSQVNLSGKWFEIVHYNVNKDTYQIDYDEVADLVRKEKPRILIAGGSAYPRNIDFKKFREIADSINCFFLADIAHISGLVATKFHENPLPYAHVVTSTTHKTLRGPRGGIIMSNDADLGKKMNSAIFPGLQGGPLMHVIAAKAVAFHEALQPSFSEYIKQVISNAQSLAHTLQSRGYNVLTGGTDNHLLLVDLRNKGITGKEAEKVLERSGITCNKNCIPFDSEKPFITSGIRLGTPAASSRGFKESEFALVGNLIADTLDRADGNNTEEVQAVVLSKITELCRQHPIY
jgi:glycine hydroxymethyltransferase